MKDRSGWIDVQQPVNIELDVEFFKGVAVEFTEQAFRHFFRSPVIRWNAVGSFPGENCLPPFKRCQFWIP